MHFDLVTLIKTIGYVGVFGIVFAESGLFFGFFLPGDSLLFTAGFLASQGFLNFPLLVILCVTGAILGDSVGYSFGKKMGQILYSKEDSRFFKKAHLEKAHAFYEKHGGKAIIIARFMPFVRTFAPIVAGTANMTYKKFLSYNIIGGILWGMGVTTAGYVLGQVVPDVDKYLLPIIVLIIIVSVAPPAVAYVKNRFHPNR
ncbi:MAG: VTT domain-containing protein [bacterium]|nr:VTT domain-containing protein [bacterium]